MRRQLSNRAGTFALWLAIAGLASLLLQSVNGSVGDLWLHVVANAGIAASFFLVPVVLLWLLRERRDLPNHRVFVLLGAFSVAHGTTHLLKIWDVARGTHWVSEAAELPAAVISLVTLVALLRWMPDALTLQSAAQLQEANARLEREVVERRRVTEALQRNRDELEHRIGLRTARLREKNEALRKEIEERRHAQLRFESVVEAAPNAMVLVDQGGRIRYVNAQTEKLFGFDRGELLNRPVGLLVPERFRERHARDVDGYVADPRCRSMGAGRDLFGRRKDGTEVSIEIGLNPLSTPEGVCVLASIIDISARKEEEDLVLAKNRELKTLLDVTSHDLREPLRTVETFSHLVSKRYSDRLDEKGLDMLARVGRAGRRMQRLLDDLLDLSRVRRLELRVETLEGGQLVDAALERLGPMIRRTEADVRVVADLPRLRAERTWATQAIYNLLTNALKFTRPEERPRIEIGPFRMNEGPRAGVGIVVRDRGPGIEPGCEDRIFGLFQRGVGREVEGTGAGLAIVQEVARRFGGEAWVQPRAGGGSEFVITFGVPETGASVEGESVECMMS